MYIPANKHPCSHVVYIVTCLDLEYQTNVMEKYLDKNQSDIAKLSIRNSSPKAH